MAKRYLTLVLCLISSILMFSANLARAGVDKRLVEIDAEERERLERERIAQQEEYKREAQRLAEERKLAEAKRQEEARLAKAQQLREKIIDELNGTYEKEVGSKDKKSGNCGFLCKLWRIITYPFRLVGKLFI
jgi:hypothetical protein